MVTKTKKSGKAKATKASAKKSASQKTSATKPAAKKPAAKKAPAKLIKKAAKKKVAAKATTKRSPATKKKATGKAAIKAADAEVTITLDEFEEIDELVSNPLPESPQSPPQRSKGPSTPTVPRAVKPPPKDIESDVNAEVLAFVSAIEAYRQENCRPFPSWTEVFHILKKLGYSRGTPAAKGKPKSKTSR